MYKILGVVFFALAFGGLFLGLLGMKYLIFRHDDVSEAFKPVGSLLSVICGAFTYLGNDVKATLNLYNKRAVAFLLMRDAALILIAIAVVLSLIVAVIALFLKNKDRVRKLVIMSGTCVAISYLWLFLHEFFSRAIIRGLVLQNAIDLSLLIIGGIALLLLFIETVITRKGMGFLSVLLTLLFVAGIFGAMLPKTVNAEIQAHAMTSWMKFYDVALILLTITLACNFFISILRLSAKRGAGFDIFRSVLQLLFLILFLIGCIAQKPFDYSRFSIFQYSLHQMVAIGLSAGSTIAALLLSIIMAISASRIRHREDAIEEAATYTLGGEKKEPAPTPASEASAPVNAPITEQAPAAEAAPAQTAQNAQFNPMQQPALGTPVVFYPMPVYSQPQSAPAQTAPAAPAAALVNQPAAAQTTPAAEAAPAQTAQPQPTIAPIPVPAAQPAPAEETPMSEFERRMAALAKGEMPEPAPTPAPQPQPKYTPPKATGAQQTSMYDPQYTYDRFLNTLTPQQKNEFGDLFIGMTHGSFGLPPYVIGGDNTEFFQKVFIYLGRFRSHISSDLLSRIYDYLNS